MSVGSIRYLMLFFSPFTSAERTVFEGETIEIYLTRSRDETNPKFKGYRIHKGDGNGTAFMYLLLDKGYIKFSGF